jgi:hypothetical protein
MNQITWLEQNLDKVKEQAFMAQQDLKKNPSSYSARVNLQTIEKRLAELQNRLQIEKTKKGSHLHNYASTSI